MTYKNLSDDTFLVCGGAGFIGSNFIRHILSEGSGLRVINFDKLTYAGNLENLADIAADARYSFVRGDIADKTAVADVFERYRPRYVINFAAETHVDRSIHGAAGDFVRTNIMGVYVLLEAVRRFGAVKFVQVSTDEVYGDLALDSGGKFQEESELKPNSPYAATKAAGDLLCRSYFQTFGLPVVVTRCGNNFGPYQYPEKLIPFFILRTMEGKTMPLYGDGSNVRDWIYVADHCRALEICLLQGKPGEVYNIGAGSEKSNKDIAHIILRHFSRDASRIEFVADRPGHDRRYALDASKIEQELGWRPQYGFEEAFASTISWYDENHSWLEKVQDKTGKLNPHLI